MPAILRPLTLRILVKIYQHSREIGCLHIQKKNLLYPEDGDSNFVGNVHFYQTSLRQTQEDSYEYLHTHCCLRFFYSFFNETPIDYTAPNIPVGFRTGHFAFHYC
jgi:hypothetical protein